jgi:hypothetical protein
MADTWHITGQQLQTELSESGTGFDTVWRVNYTVDSGAAVGTKGYVNVPAAQYNKDTVQKAVAAAVYHLHQVAGL